MMMQTSPFEKVTDNHFKIHGEMTLHSVTPLLAQSVSFFNNTNKIIFDLNFVKKTDNAGLALLIEWLRLGRKKNVMIEFLNLPAQLVSLATVCELLTLFTQNNHDESK
ncbi:MAG: hypothetical protein LEGION0398_MBIBDBAK_00700 [Legionellaceae bacterium]